MDWLEEDIRKIKRLILCSRVAQELGDRAGIEDQRVSEQLVGLGEEALAEDDFTKKVSSIRPKITLPTGCLSEVFALVKKNQPSQELKKAELHHLSQRFPGLALQNEEIPIELSDAEEKPKPTQAEVLRARKQKFRSRSRSRTRRRRSSERNQERRGRRRRSPSTQRGRRRRSPSTERGRRRRSQSTDRGRRRRSQSLDAHRKVQVGEVYEGLVTRVEEKGCFVQLHKVSGRRHGYVSLADMSRKPLKHAIERVDKRQRVWVRVLAVTGEMIRLSMIDICQQDGKLLQWRQQKPDKDQGRITGIRLAQQGSKGNTIVRRSDSDLWLQSRLRYMAGMSYNLSNANEPLEEIEEINIAVNDREPPFLRGQTTKAGIRLSPVRVVKNPEGTLQREAMNALHMARERREVREAQQRLMTDRRHGDTARHFQDPTEVPKLANQLVSESVAPDWLFRHSSGKLKRSNLKEQQCSLPIFQYKQELVKAVLGNKVLIVIGETGSGKTTQITQYLVEAGYTRGGKQIGCTQPRRVAAMSVAKRVSEEMGVPLGEQVGYSIRFEDFTSHKTIIKYMTDGMLLREALLDKDLLHYSVIMLDEAHERTIHTDVLFGILKQVVSRRDDFTLVVTSATLEALKFSSYFYNCKIFRIPGRTFPVEMLYAKQPQSDYLEAALLCVLQIHLDEPPGDILLFLTGQEEIDTACQMLTERVRKMGPGVQELLVLPVYSALPSEQQTRIFEPAPAGTRKCVIATNIAEASLTIDGIYFVVDPGFAKIKIYNPKVGMDSLVVAPISQASAKQRAGRAGRTGPGKCYRLYTEHAYKNQMLPVTVPEIQRANLSNTVLELKAMGINDLIRFDFMDPPPVQTLIAALEQLYYLAALDDQGLLTKLGRRMAEFPLEPPLSKMLLTSVDLGCSEEIVTIISMLSVQNIFYRPKDKQTIADQKRARLNHPEGDHLTYLAVYEQWKQSNFSTVWCHENYVQARSMKRAQEVRKQLSGLLQRYRLQEKSCGGKQQLIRKAIVAGYFSHVAKKQGKDGFWTLGDEHQVYIHPSSSLFNKEPEWVVYHELVMTTKEYMRDVCAIQPKWLLDVAPNFFKECDQAAIARRKLGDRIEALTTKHGDPNSWKISERKG